MADETNAAPTAEELAAQKEAARRAELMAHPHTQLKGILTVLQSPAANQADVNTRLAHLQSAVRQLTQVILTHTPPPPEDLHGEEQRLEQQHAQGSQQPQPGGL